MKAIRYHAHGGPEVLRYEDAPDPEIRSGEVIVRVRACALNHLDLWNRRGVVKLPLPHIGGADVAGDIADTSDPNFRVGQRVMLQPGLSCGYCEACVAGRDHLCPRYDVLGSQSDGGYAEFVPQSDPVARCDRLCRSRGVSADVSHRLAHAHHAGRGAVGR
jgi:NADPH:quinone reductase-like Zn-dependent oxidoreductase